MEWQSLADQLIDSRHARSYDSGEREGWCGDLPPLPETEDGMDTDPLELYDDDNNGRISCPEARNHGIAPVYRGHPAYPYMDDRNDDGVVCESAVSGKMATHMKGLQMKNLKQRILTLKSSRYQPTKAELEEEIKLNVPGNDVHERADNLARAVLRPAEIRYEKAK